jgi:hypothetical protein
MTYPFTDSFEGFEKLDVVKQIFGSKAQEVLRHLRVEFIGMRRRGGYMGVSEVDGHLVVSCNYLNTGDIIDIYLDVIHELVHVKQFMDGKELFDDNYSYVERPTEIEAYEIAVKEARNLGLSDKRICDYLKTEWMSDDELKCLADRLKVRCAKTSNK